MNKKRMIMLQTKKHTYERVRWYVVCLMVLVCTSFSHALSAAHASNMGNRGIATNVDHEYPSQVDNLFNLPFLPNNVNSNLLPNSPLLDTWDDQGSMQLSNDSSPFSPVLLPFNRSPRHDGWSNHSDISNIPSPPLSLGNEDASVNIPPSGMLMPLIMPETMATTTTVTNKSNGAIGIAPSKKKRKPVKKNIGLKKEVKQQKVHHQQKKGKFACGTCEKFFTQKGSLNRHIKGVHLKEKPHQCAYCQKGFPQKNDLKRHVRTHTGEKSYPCFLCSKSFKRGDGLKRHIENTHLNKKRYQCPKCKRKFGESGHLKRHIRSIHNQEKPFKCELCSKKYKRKQSLNDHMKKKHSEVSQ